MCIICNSARSPKDIFPISSKPYFKPLQIARLLKRAGYCKFCRILDTCFLSWNRKLQKHICDEIMILNSAGVSPHLLASTKKEYRKFCRIRDTPFCCICQERVISKVYCKFYTISCALFWTRVLEIVNTCVICNSEIGCCC